jgi:acylphosphatase
MKRLEATVYGRVQGVSFRYYTQREAQQHSLTGWVANKRDGTVKVVAEGAEKELQQLQDFLKRGPAMARVDRVDVDLMEATGEFTRFDIRWL